MEHLIGESMKTFSGSLADRPWVGWLVEREADLPGFRRWVARHATAGTMVGFDLETTGKGAKMFQDPNFIRMAQFGTETESWAIPVEHGPAFVDAAVCALRSLPRMSGHNLIDFDAVAVDRHWCVTLEELVPKLTDTMISSKLIDPRKSHQGGIGASLKQQCAVFVDPASPDAQTELDEVFKSLGVGHNKDNGAGWASIPWNHPDYVRYALLDPILNTRLLAAHERELERLSVRPYLMPYEHELSRVAAVMVRAGLPIDEEYTVGFSGDLEHEYDYWVGEAASHGVLSVGSTDKVTAKLWDMGERWTKRSKKTGKLSGDASVLRPMADIDEDWERIGAREPNPVANAVLRANRARKWRSTYAEKFLTGMDGNGLLHPGIQTLEARTGRMSIVNPSAQNMPSGNWTVRRCVDAGTGNRVISCDFKAVELRVLAALANVSRMKEAITAGRDLHDFTTELVYGSGAARDKRLRTICKKIGLGQVYGAGLDTLVAQTGAPIDQVKSTKKEYGKAYPEISRSSSRWRREAFETGYATISATGRRLPVDAHRMYTVVNLQCQSAGRDVLGKALLRMDQAGLLPYLRLPIHDEVVAFAPAGEAHDVAWEIERCMTFDLRGVPIDAEADVGGQTWGSLYMKDSKGRPDPGLMTEMDPYWAANPAEARALAAA